ncbi:MAG: hypothetical protein V4510_10215 [bacterium]
MRIVKKTLKGDLMGRTGFKSVQPKRRGAADPTKPRDPAQRVLDEVRDDEITVITEPVPVRHGKAIVLNADHQEVPPPGTNVPGGLDVHLAGAPPMQVPGAPPLPAAKPRKLGNQAAAPAAAPPSAPPPASRALGLTLDGGSIPLARSVLAEALFRDIGAPGTKVQQPKGSHFVVHPKIGAGVVRTQHNLMLPLPEGHATSHAADLVIELENGALLMLDIVPSSIGAADLKALAFDALQLRRLDLAFSVLVFVRSPGNGMPQEQAAAIGHGYDFHFGVGEEQLHSAQSFAALRARIEQWLKAASAK